MSKRRAILLMGIALLLQGCHKPRTTTANSTASMLVYSYHVDTIMQTTHGPVVFLKADDPKYFLLSDGSNISLNFPEGFQLPDGWQPGSTISMTLQQVTR